MREVIKMSKVYKRSSHLLYTIGICVFSMIMISSIVIPTLWMTADLCILQELL